MTEKYKLHGLTREEDNILSAFGREDIEKEAFPIHYFAGQFDTFHLDALRSLIRKGLIEAKVTDGLTVRFKLTRKGMDLWRTRAKEEEEGLTVTKEVTSQTTLSSTGEY
jgi:hypothetical protein